MILFTGGRGSASVMLGYHTPWQGRPPSKADPPGKADPPAQCMLGDTINKRAVCILLECNPCPTIWSLSMYWKLYLKFDKFTNSKKENLNSDWSKHLESFLLTSCTTCSLYILFINVNCLSLYPLYVVGFEYFASQCNALLLLESESRLEIESCEATDEGTIITANQN